LPRISSHFQLKTAYLQARLWLGADAPRQLRLAERVRGSGGGKKEKKEKESAEDDGKPPGWVKVRARAQDSSTHPTPRCILWAPSSNHPR
jgi:hypothetical protein